ncbi:MAG: GNAT family N-acetyltransferase [Pseudomonadota bacterium]
MSRAFAATRNLKPDFEFSAIKSDLPETLAPLRRDAAAEGYAFVERLYDEWASGAVRFDRADERLISATLGDEIAAIGGVTRDIDDPNTLRMRRFYVRPSFRRRGFARRLALRLLDMLKPSGAEVRVNAGTETAPQFWESVGFQPVGEKGHTHVLRRAGG